MEKWIQQFDAYPRWVVWASLILTAVAVLWTLGSVMKWMFKVVLALALLAAVGGILVWALA